MDYKELIENHDFSSPAKVADWIWNTTCAITDLLARAEAAEARAEKAEKIASDLCDDFTDFVTSGIHNAAPYCANRRPECVDDRGWCNVDMKTCRGFYPEAAKKEE